MGVNPLRPNFRARVEALAAKHGLQLAWESISPKGAAITVWRAGTPRHVLTIREIDTDCCRSAYGTVYTVADVVQRLRGLLERRTIG